MVTDTTDTEDTDDTPLLAEATPFVEDEVVDTAPRTPDAPFRLDALTKHYGTIPALTDFSYTPTAGQIHTILGDHQSGKSTLLNLIGGMTTPDSGRVRWFGRGVRLPTAGAALALGIGLVPQRPALIPTLDVRSNILLGTDEEASAWARRDATTKIRRLARAYDLLVTPAASVHSISDSEALHAELLRLLYRDLSILLLDDPFARLHPQDHAPFRATLRQLAEEGKTILYSTTRPDDALQCADHILVLKAGKMVRPTTPSQSSVPMLYHAMTGLQQPPVLPRPDAALGAVVLSTRRLAADANPTDPALHNITLDLRRGDVLAVLGLPHQGQQSLADILRGVQPHTAGQWFIGSDEVLSATIADGLRQGIRFAPPLGDSTTLAQGMTVAENLVLYQPQWQGWQAERRRTDHARELLHLHAINATPATRVRDLTPTEQHRLALARATAGAYRLLVALYPTRGVAIEQATAIRQHLLAERARGNAILLFTHDPHEAATLADRTAVLREGRIVAMVERDSPQLALLPAMLTGDDALAAL